LEDIVIARGEHKMEMFFHLATGVNVLETNDYDFTIIHNDNIKSEISFECENKINLKVIDDTVSPSYGKINDSKTLIIGLEFIDKINITTKIKWIKK